MTLVIPEEKRLHAINMLQTMMRKRKVRVKEIQALCGYLNFLNKAVYPGRAFTRRMYAKFSKVIDFSEFGLSNKGHNSIATQKQEKSKTKTKLQQHHHIRLDEEFKFDCEVWLRFLTDSHLRKVVSRPMLDFDDKQNSKDIGFYSDTSKAPNLGYGMYLLKKMDLW